MVIEVMGVRSTVGWPFSGRDRMKGMRMKMPTVDELRSREAIREVANRYSHGVDRLDGDWMKSAYWPDAIDDHGVFVGNAWDFVDRCMGSHERFRWTMHSTRNHQIDFDDDGVHARGELYNLTYLCRADIDTFETWHGRYLDRYERRGDEWRIIHRVCVHEGSSTRPIGAAMPIDAAAFRQGSFDRQSAGRAIGP